MREKTFKLYEKNFVLCERKHFKWCVRKDLSSMREKALSCVRKKQWRFCKLNHLGNLVLAILANLVNLLNWVLAILVHFAPFWLIGFILCNWVDLLAILVNVG